MITIGSLFTGYGGLDLATEAVFGGRTVWTSDVDPGACKIIDHRFGDVPNLGDITAIDWTQVEPVDVLTGGFPCQDLSAAGKRAGLRPGTRSGLWQHMAYAIDQLRPRYVIAENVRGLLSAEAHSDVEPCPWCVGDGSDGHLRALGAVLGDLADLGYDASWCGLRAADVGAPHGRFRVFILATDTNSQRIDGSGRARDRRPEPSNGDRGPLALLPTPTARDWKDGRRVEGVDENALLGRVVWNLLPTPTATPYGSNQSDSPGAAVRPSLDGVTRRLLPTPTVVDAKGGRNATAGRSPNAKPHADGWTLSDVAYADRFGRYAEAIARWEPIVGRPAPDPTDDGRLSARFVEWMMGLPSGWVTDVPGLTRAQQLKALGNGVVPQQAAAAIHHMITALGGEAA